MVDQPGEFDLRAEDVDAIVKNFALEQFTGRQICTIVKTSSESNVYFEETDSDITPIQTTGMTSQVFETPEGSIFEHMEHSWTEVTERVKMHGGTHTMSWQVWKLSAFDVKARMLERVSRAVVLAEDNAIWTELATTTNTAAALQTWDKAKER